jgi:hypothetical protein
MKKKELLNNVKELGFPLFETKKSMDANKTLAEVTKSKDSRLWEGFPLLLANALERGLFNYREALRNFKDSKLRNDLRKLVLMSLALYKYLGLKFSNSDKLYKSNYFNKKLFDKFLYSFKEKKDLKWTGKQLSTVRVASTFKNYFKHAEINFKDYLSMKDDFEFEYALSQLFSNKQKELIMKKLKGEKMTKTESEYFSRSVKKKIVALANSDLHKLATKLIKE